MSYKSKTGTGLNKSVFKMSEKLHTDGFYIPVWMSRVLKEQERDKSAVVRDALMDYFEEHGLLPEEVSQR